MTQLARPPLAAIDAALDLLPRRMTSPRARILMLAIGYQESRFTDRWQIVDLRDRGRKGPARGFWQFETTGCAGVLSHRASAHWAAAICTERRVAPSAREVWHAVEQDDVLAAAFARLLLWTDAQPLPAERDVQGAWDCYIRTWRPGKPHRHTWDALHAEAARLVIGEE